MATPDVVAALAVFPSEASSSSSGSWSLIIVLIGLIAFGGFARGKWY